MKNKVESRKYGVGISIVLVMILVTILSSCKKLKKSMVYVYYDESYLPVGIIKGGVRGKIFGYSVFVKASEIVEQMGVYPY